MFLLLDSEEAVLCTVTAATVLSVLLLIRERDRLDLDRRVSLGLMIPVVPGVLVGGAALGLIEKAYLQVAVGLVVLGAVIWQETGGRRERSPEREFAFRRSAIPAGFVGGSLNGAVSTGGPPIALWLRSANAGPNQMRHTLAVVFIAMNLLTIAVIVALDSPVVDAEWGRALGGALVGVPLGYAIGGRVLARIGRLTFERLVAAAIAAVGLASAIVGLSSL